MKWTIVHEFNTYKLLKHFWKIPRILAFIFWIFSSSLPLKTHSFPLNYLLFLKYETIWYFRLFVDGIMRDPLPSVFPLKISGLEANRTYVFEAQATQFSQEVQSNSVSVQTPNAGERTYHNQRTELENIGNLDLPTIRTK